MTLPKRVVAADEESLVGTSDVANSTEKEMRNSDLWIGVIGALIGALFGGVSRLTIERYQAFKDAEGIAAALRAEIDALLNLVEARQYPARLDLIIQRLEGAQAASLTDYFDPPMARDYFPVFKSIVPKIGILREAGAPTVKAYMLAQSAIEDVHALQEERRRVESGTIQPDHHKLLASTRELKRVMDDALRAGREAITALDRFLEKRWLYLLP